MSYTNRDFNPSCSTQVDTIKEAAENLARAIEAECPSGQLKDRAILDCQSASMFAVKSLFY
jgi:predicted RNase H-like HicB family nuclease